MIPAKKRRTQTNYLLALEQTSTEMDSTAMQEALELLREIELYAYLDKEQSLRDSSEVLEDFYEERSDENIGLLQEMEKAIANNDLVLAAYLRDQVIDDNLVTSAYKSVLNTLLKYENGSFTSSDLDELWYWANTCRYLYGNATVLAQNGYNCIQRESRVFEENCPSNLQKSMQLETNGSETDLKLTLYPNPTDGHLFILSNKIGYLEGECTISSLDGREVYSGTIDFLEGLSLNNLSMTNGVYIIKIYVANETFHEQFVYFK